MKVTFVAHMECVSIKMVLCMSVTLVIIEFKYFIIVSVYLTTT